MATALLFDRDRADEVNDWMESLPTVGLSAILWIDLETPPDHETVHLLDAVDLETRTADDLRRKQAEPMLVDHGAYLHVPVIGLSDDRYLVSDRWLVTLHDKPVEVVERCRKIAGDQKQSGGSPALAFWRTSSNGPLELLQCLRGARPGSRGDRRQSDARHRLRYRRRPLCARRDATGGGATPPCARLASRGRALAHSPRARGDRDELGRGRALLDASRSARGGRAGVARRARVDRRLVRPAPSRARDNGRTRS